MESVEDERKGGDLMLSAECSVCGSPAALHLHYGAVSCYSCRAFFRRGPPRQIRCIFGHNRCKITRFNRTNCKQCRYTKCIEVGMLPEKVDATVNKKREREARLQSSSQAQGLVSATTSVNHWNQPPEKNQQPENKSNPSEQTSWLTPGTDVRRLSLNGGAEKKNKETWRKSWSSSSTVSSSSSSSLRTSSASSNSGRGSIRVKDKQFMLKEEFLTQPNPREMYHKHFHDIARMQNLVRNRFSSSESEQSRMYRLGAKPQSATSSSSFLNLQPWFPNRGFMDRTSPGRLEDQPVREPGAANIYYKNPYIDYNPSPLAHDWTELRRPIVHLSETRIRPAVSTHPQGQFQEDMFENYSRIMEVPDFQTVLEPDTEPVHGINRLSSEGPSSPLIEPEQSRRFYDIEERANPRVQPQVVPEFSRNFTVIQGPQSRSLKSEKNVSDLISGVFDVNPRPNPRVVLHESLTRPWIEVPEKGSPEQIEEREETVVSKPQIENVLLNQLIDLECPNKRKLTEENDEFPAEPRAEPTGSGSPIPLKKRARMYQLVYPIGHGINKTAMPILTFTFEEEFMLVDYVVRIEEYQNRRFDFLMTNFRNYNKLLASYVTYTHLGRKVPYSKGIEKTLFKLGLEFTKSNCHKIFNEMSSLGSEVRSTVLNSTYPALYIVFFSILEGNTREATWFHQHKKTLHITENNHEMILHQLGQFINGRSISLKDQERFTSPWARDLGDEDRFERVISILGRILRDDKKLQALYHMLVMMTPSVKTSLHIQTNPDLQRIQIRLVQLIYRYLSTTAQDSSNLDQEICLKDSSLMNLSADMVDLSPAEKTHLLIGLIDDVHDCADILQNRSLPGHQDTS